MNTRRKSRLRSGRGGCRGSLGRSPSFRTHWPLVYALAPLGVAHEEIVADDCAVVERCLAHLRPGCTQTHNVANLVTVGDEVVGDDTPVAAPPHRLGAHDCGGGFRGVRP